MSNIKTRSRWGLLIVTFVIPFFLWGAEGDTWIVFDCNRPIPNTTEFTYWNIWKLDPDGDGSQSNDSLFGIPLTSDPANEWDPTYSAEARSVVFVSDRDGWPHLYKVSIDGGAWQGFLFGNYCTADPCYSFNDTKIAYASKQNENWDIYMMDTSGYNKKQITTNLADDRSPCFSTDGSKIYFISNRDENEIGDWEIYVIDTTGVGIATKVILNAQDQPLLLDYTEHDPCCSPTDANIIIFTTNVATPTYSTNEPRINFELFSYDFTTRDTNRLTESWNDAVGKQLWNSSMPCFSPDGERIAWSADNWTGISWQSDNHPEGPYNPSYWKPPSNPGASHQIWIRHKDENDDNYWFPPSYWAYNGPTNPPTPWPPGHQHHKHYNPSWDWLEPQE